MKKNIIILLFVLLVSCSKEQEEKKVFSNNTIPQENDINKNSQVFDIETNIGGNYVDKVQTSENKTIPNKLLAEVLPLSIPDTKPNAYKYGNLLENNIQISISSREYLYSPDSYIKFAITDYYDYTNIPKIEKRAFEKDLNISGKSYRKFYIKDNPYYILVDEPLKEAKLVLLYDKRIIIKIESFNIDLKKYLIDDFIRYIDFKKLDKLVKNYK